MRRPRALTFDVFGTVVDWRSPIIREGEILTRSRKAPEVDWERFANAWRAGYPVAMDRVRKGEIPWTNLDALHRQILNSLLPEFGIHGLSEADLAQFNFVWHRLDPWPDAVEGLERLRRHFTIAALSNGNVSLLVDLSKHAGLTWDCILSAELARHYKPDREVYEMAANYLGLAPGDVMMVAAHQADLRAAQGVGFQTAYVPRPGERGPYAKNEEDGHFDLTAHDFLDLAVKTGVTSAAILAAARECGFELAGIASADPSPDHGQYRDWVQKGMAGAMSYLTDRRMEMRQDPRHLLPTARSIICAGKLYNVPQPYSTAFSDSEKGWISRYAWSDDYHDTLRRDLEKLVAKLPLPADYRICVDTAPLLERSYAYRAGLGWIGKNTCLINEPWGSWFFLGEILTSLELPAADPAPDRCGTCTRCIEACPTGAISAQGYELDARLCISYFTIELRGPAPVEHRAQIGANIFGCDICQDVCPWNRRAPVTGDSAFAVRQTAPPLEEMSRLTEAEFRDLFRSTPVSRAKYAGFLRNVATAMGNSGKEEFRSALERLAQFPNEAVREHAQWALARLSQTGT